MILKPMFKYFGGKYRSAPYYPPPKFKTIIEPFAGSAGYSLRYPQKQIILIEKYEKIFAIWQYLIKVSPSEVRALPLLDEGDSIDDFNITQEAKWLIGFWLNAGAAAPCKTPCTWMISGIAIGSFWGPRSRERIARQVDAIKHWKVIYGDYTDAPDIEATWFIDPPYQDQGIHYKHSSHDIDFSHLSEWCKSRNGQKIVCENVGADWLPFDSFRTIKGTEGKYRTGISKEAIYHSFFVKE